MYKGIRKVALIALLAVASGCPLEAPSSGESAGTSYFRGSAAEVTFNIPCEHLDVDASSAIERNELLTSRGGTSASTGHAFHVVLPATAALLRDPALLRDYPIVPYSDFSGGGADDSSKLDELFQFGLKLRRPTGVWVSCGDSCGAGVSFNRISHIVEVRDEGGKATFRITGELRAQLRGIDASEVEGRGEFTGGWSLLVTVADPRSDGGR